MDFFWIDADACHSGNGFCPGHVGDERTYHGEIDLNGTAELWSTPGSFVLAIDNGSTRLIIAHFPVLGYS